MFWIEMKLLCALWRAEARATGMEACLSKGCEKSGHSCEYAVCRATGIRHSTHGTRASSWFQCASRNALYYVLQLLEWKHGTQCAVPQESGTVLTEHGPVLGSSVPAGTLRKLRSDIRPGFSPLGFPRHCLNLNNGPQIAEVRMRLSSLFWSLRRLYPDNALWKCAWWWMWNDIAMPYWRKHFSISII
jgi:hypothetical protein